MAGPFPGMDPYLEDPVLWPGVHHLLITFLGTTLNKLLQPRYVARIQERLYLVQPDRDIYPDVSVRKRRRSRPLPAASASAATLAVASDRPWVLSIEPEEIREPFIDIVPIGDRGRVITTLEVLSPINKAAGTEGRAQYRAKQKSILRSPVHLVEIDLLRQGEHSVAAPRERLLRRGPWDYLVSVSEGGRRDVCKVWPATLRRRLPRFDIPLASSDQDIGLDLQTLVDRVYDEGAFGAELDYRAEPIVPLSGADASWADGLLRRLGLRGMKAKHPKKKGEQ